VQKIGNYRKLGLKERDTQGEKGIYEPAQFLEGKDAVRGGKIFWKSEKKEENGRGEGYTQRENWICRFQRKGKRGSRERKGTLRKEESLKEGKGEIWGGS